MDIEELSKTQLLLLTILVSFVTSIATGVLTAALLDQTPTTVTQTVNRIVDHTIETVTTQVPTTIGNPQPEAPSSEELLVNALAANAARRVTLYRDDSQRSVVGTGLYLPSARAVLTVNGDAPTRAFAVFAGGETAQASRNEKEGNIVAYFFTEDTALPQAPSPRLVPIAEAKLGQTVISLSSEGTATTGIISKIEEASIVTDLPQVPAGAGVVNLAGEVVGISAGGGTLFSSDRISALLAP